MRLVVVVLGAEQILASCAAAAPKVGWPGRRGAATGREEGRMRGRRAAIGRQAVGEDGWLDVAQEQRLVVQVVVSVVPHGENAVAFTWRGSEVRREGRKTGQRCRGWKVKEEE